MRDLGSIQSPQNAFYVMNGLESLHVRMERHCKNALEIARFLKANDKVAGLIIPTLKMTNITHLLKSISERLMRCTFFCG
mgnify:CR=1 FL=1